MKIIFGLSFLFAFLLFSCNSDKKPKREEGPTSAVETLKQEIDDIHIQGMSKMAALTKFRQQTSLRIDSLVKAGNKVPAAYKTTLDSLLSNLTRAETRMDEWMNEFYSNQDTLADNEAERMKYLEGHKIKAKEITDAITRNIHTADSVLKIKF